MNFNESNWSQIEKRLNLQSIGEFLRNGSDITEVDRHSFTERRDTAYNDLRAYIEKTCGNERLAGMVEKIAAYSIVIEDIYFSLGMKVGAQLTIKLTTNLESDF